jgi:hypothetical protein
MQIIIKDQNGLGSFEWKLPDKLSELIKKIQDEAIKNVRPDKREHFEKLVHSIIEAKIMGALAKLLPTLPLELYTILTSESLLAPDASSVIVEDMMALVQTLKAQMENVLAQHTQLTFLDDLGEQPPRQ